MSGQEEYLDKLLRGLNEEPEDSLEDISFEDEDIDVGEMEDIDEDAFFEGESMEMDDLDPQFFEDIEKDETSGAAASETDFQEEQEEQEDAFLEDSIPLEEEELDFNYEDAGEKENLDSALDALSELGEAEDFGSLLDTLPETEGDEESGQADLDSLDSFIPEELDEAEVQELPEDLMEELEIPEDTLEDIGQEEDISDMLPESVNEEDFDGEMQTDEISDEQALANVLNTFSDEEEEPLLEESLQELPEEEEPLQEEFLQEISEEEEPLQEEFLQEAPEEEAPLAEEAVLDTPQDLGLELEEEDEVEEEAAAEVSQKKKKKEKKKKIKKVKEENQEKKPSLLARLLEDDADEEPTQEELEEQAAKKAEKEEQKQAKKEAAAEKKQQAKEAAAAKKAEKEAEKKRKKEAEEPPEPWPPFTKKIIPMLFLFGAAFVTVVIVLSNVLSYSPYISNARQYFDDRQYEKAYEQLMGIDIKEKDQTFFDQVFLMNQFQIKVISSKNHLLNGEKELALNDLVQAVLFYNGNLEKAAGLGLEKEFQIVYSGMEAALSESFGISVKDAEELGAVTDAKEYQSRIAEIVQ